MAEIFLTPKVFTTKLEAFYNSQKRDLPWRRPVSNGNFDPYQILVSEIMLQQTQVTRVIPKYQQFLEQFPNVKTLSSSPLATVLQVWSGLGYNRRAKYLWQAAQQLQQLGYFPDTESELVKLPGVGHNTTGAIMAYAFNKPAVFIETNVRSVFIHEFFPSQEAVADTALLPLIEQTLSATSLSPRDFYWALMDYGSYLKSMHPNPSRRSQHHSTQSTFQGSKRQVRGQVLKLLSSHAQTKSQLQQQITDQRLGTVLADLMNELLVQKHGQKYQLYN